MSSKEIHHFSLCANPSSAADYIAYWNGQRHSKCHDSDNAWKLNIHTKQNHFIPTATDLKFDFLKPKQTPSTPQHPLW